MKNYLFFLVVFCLFGCQKESKSWSNPLEQHEISMLKAAIDKIEPKEIDFFIDKIKSLSDQTILLNEWDSVRKFEEFNVLYEWIKNEVKNFPLSFYQIIYEEKITGEEKSICVGLLWDCARELHPSIYKDMVSKNDFNSINLIIQLLPLY